MAPILEACGLTKHFGRTQALGRAGIAPGAKRLRGPCLEGIGEPRGLLTESYFA